MDSAAPAATSTAGGDDLRQNRLRSVHHVRDLNRALVPQQKKEYTMDGQRDRKDPVEVVAAAIAALGEETAASIAAQAGMAYSTVTPKLRALEAAGRAEKFRRDGQTLWRLTAKPTASDPDQPDDSGGRDDPSGSAPQQATEPDADPATIRTTETPPTTGTPAPTTPTPTTSDAAPPQHATRPPIPAPSPRNHPAAPIRTAHRAVAAQGAHRANWAGPRCRSCSRTRRPSTRSARWPS
jgi:DNA-binding transcriptional ArsR family regulator